MLMPLTTSLASSGASLLWAKKLFMLTTVGNIKNIGVVETLLKYVVQDTIDPFGGHSVTPN